MQNTSSYYTAPLNDGLMKGWLRSGRAANASWGSSANSHTLMDDEDLPSPLLEIDDQIADALQCMWAPSSSSDDSDPFASRPSLATDVFELPEVPFVAAPARKDDEVDEFDSPFWLRRRPAVSTTSSERQIAILGQASQRILGHCRQRSGSISSTASRPAPAKSILSSSSSIKTRNLGRSPPSVKFLDMPTIHFEDEDEGLDYEPEPNCDSRKMKPGGGGAKSKKRAFGLLDWIVGPKKAEARIPDRPLISGPLPLWEGRRSSESVSPHRCCASPTDARSIRSVKSTTSMRSTRSCASRLHGYWTRFSGRDP